MRNTPNLRIEQYRATDVPGYESSVELGNNGLFMLPKKLVAMASDGAGWDHVSVSFGRDATRCPTWEEMCYVKGLFFKDDEVVIQYHPAKEASINCHEYCLHMWRPQEVELPLPDPIMVGPPS